MEIFWAHLRWFTESVTMSSSKTPACYYWTVALSVPAMTSLTLGGPSSPVICCEHNGCSPEPGRATLHARCMSLYSLAIVSLTTCSSTLRSAVLDAKIMRGEEPAPGSSPLPKCLSGKGVQTQKATHAQAWSCGRHLRSTCTTSPGGPGGPSTWQPARCSRQALSPCRTGTAHRRGPACSAHLIALAQPCMQRAAHPP